MLHALKLYYNRIHSFLDYIPDGKLLQKNFLVKEATETFLQIQDIESKLDCSLDEQYEVFAETEELIGSSQSYSFS